MSGGANRVAVLDYGMGNLRSVAKAIETTGATVSITSDRATVEAADALCVPGQGIFGRCVERLGESGFDELIRSWAIDQRPYLGICLGMQILFDVSEEQGPVEGLGILGGEVRRLAPKGGRAPLRVPHMGWNQLTSGTLDGEYFYFDHSYAVHPSDPSIVTGWCEHGERFAAAVRSGSIEAVEFHPEKSGRAGLALLDRWLTSARVFAERRSGGRM